MVLALQCWVGNDVTVKIVLTRERIWREFGLPTLMAESCNWNAPCTFFDENCDTVNKIITCLYHSFRLIHAELSATLPGHLHVLYWSWFYCYNLSHTHASVLCMYIYTVIWRIQLYNINSVFKLCISGENRALYSAQYAYGSSVDIEICK